MRICSNIVYELYYIPRQCIFFVCYLANYNNEFTLNENRCCLMAVTRGHQPNQGRGTRNQGSGTRTRIRTRRNNARGNEKSGHMTILPRTKPSIVSLIKFSSRDFIHYRIVVWLQSYHC